MGTKGFVPPNNRHRVHRDPDFSIDNAAYGLIVGGRNQCPTLQDLWNAMEAGCSVRFPVDHYEKLFVLAYGGLAYADNHREFFRRDERAPEPTGHDREPFYSLYWLREYLRARPSAKKHLDNSVLTKLKERFKTLEPRPPAELLLP